ncbi:MAG: STAS domain-containing protein [Candidatus Riflebacteria bacterium]|nr:STAS domain-containing protein [Candidatus Riflebacteria bacterium]
MSENYILKQTEENGIVIFSIVGYFGEKVGEELVEKIEELLCAKKGRVILDLSECTVLCSPGIGSIIEIVGMVVEEYNGTVVICGLDPIKQKVLALTQVTAIARVAKDLQDAKKIA